MAQQRHAAPPPLKVGIAGVGARAAPIGASMPFTPLPIVLQTEEDYIPYPSVHEVAWLFPPPPPRESARGG